MTNSNAIAPAGTADHRAALLAGYLGWTLDAFDFFLVVSCLTAIGTEFHKSDAEMALTLTATLAFRPAGAFFFGLLADRYGRRLPLMIVMIFYSLMEMLAGLAPNYTTFLVLGALFGIGMGGEWGVGASLAMEKVPVRLRGAPVATVHLRPERDATKLQAVVRSRATSRLVGSNHPGGCFGDGDPHLR